MTLAKITPEQMKELEKKVGQHLLKKHGKKKHYTTDQIKKSCQSMNIETDWHCWAMCFFSEHESFDIYHRTIGETCDYLSMKSQMVSALTDGASDSWVDFDFDISWLELPDLDFSDFFDFFD